MVCSALRRAALEHAVSRHLQHPPVVLRSRAFLERSFVFFHPVEARQNGTEERAAHDGRQHERGGSQERREGASGVTRMICEIRCLLSNGREEFEFNRKIVTLSANLQYRSGIFLYLYLYTGNEIS